jgi:DNA repair and recombination RAD54-like protein
MFINTPSHLPPSCDLIICDEAHKLKNAESGLSKCLNLLPAKKRILLSGTPMQNELTEFYNMVNFCNPGMTDYPYLLTSNNVADFRVNV